MSEPSRALHRPLRVAFLIDSLDAGGTELNAVRTAERLDRERFDLRLYAFRGDGSLRERFQRAGVPITELPVRSLASVSALRQARRLAGELRRWNADVLHCHDRYSNVLGALAGRLAGTPAVIASRRWWWFDRTSHAVLNGMAYRSATRVLANSPAVAGLLRDEGVGGERIDVVPNFVDDELFELSAVDARQALLGEIGAPSESLIVGIVANLRPVKDHVTLVRAVASLASRWPELRLVCAGTGPTASVIRETADAHGVADRVHLLGARDGAARLHAAFDISVLCSLHEGFPNSVIEAMAAGRPVVGTRIGGIPDAVLDEHTGLLVAPGDATALAAALERLLTDAALRRRMGAAGRARAREVHAASAVIPRVEALYASAVGAARNFGEVRGVTREDASDMAARPEQRMVRIGSGA